MTIAELLTQVDSLSLQALCRYMYRIGVPRIQSRFSTPLSIDHFIAINVPYCDEWKAPLVHYNTKTKKCSWNINNIMRFDDECKTFQIESELILLRSDDPMTVSKITGLND